MIEEKGLDELAADKIGEYVQLNGNIELVDQLLKNEHLTKVPAAVAGLEATKLLLNYCNILGLQNEILFDLSLARGLDYYTGVIYEAVLKGRNLDFCTHTKIDPSVNFAALNWNCTFSNHY